MNHSAMAQRLPFETAVTPCMFSWPAEKPTILPHFGTTYTFQQEETNNDNKTKVEHTSTKAHYQSVIAFIGIIFKLHLFPTLTTKSLILCGLVAFN